METSIDCTLDKDLAQKVRDWARAHSLTTNQFVNMCVRIQVMPQTVNQLHPWGDSKQEREQDDRADINDNDCAGC